MALVKVWNKDKRIVVNNFLKHFFFSLLIFGLMILIEYLQYQSLTLDSELLVLLFMFIVDLLLAGKKALEEYNAEWSKKFKWIWEYVYVLIEIIIRKIKK